MPRRNQASSHEPKTSYGAFVVTTSGIGGNAGAARILPKDVLPQAIKTHPRGFRVLSHESPFERQMRSYFRLQPKPPLRVRDEMHRVTNLLQQQDQTVPDPPKQYTSSPRKRRRKKKMKDNVVLDGFMVLAAAQVEDPDTVREISLQNANLVGTVSEDLAFFANLEFVDVGENRLKLTDFKALEKLTEMHIHCNGISTLEVPPSFRYLHTLNLSFNNLSVSDALETLSDTVAGLERLDLSCNHRTGQTTCDVFPPTLLGLRRLRQLALENNRITDDCKAFECLSALPSLVEVNLNHNMLTKVPSLQRTVLTGSAPPPPVGGGDDVTASTDPVDTDYLETQEPFPKLEVLGLSENKLGFFEDVYPMVSWTNLRRVVLHANPVQLSRRDVDLIFYEFGNVSITVVLDGPLPQKRDLGSFYVSNATNMVQVNEFRRVTMRPLFTRNADDIIHNFTNTANTSSGVQQPQNVPSQSVQEVDVPTAGGAGSFFVTQPEELVGRTTTTDQQQGNTSNNNNTSFASANVSESKHAYEIAQSHADAQNASFLAQHGSLGWDAMLDSPAHTPDGSRVGSMGGGIRGGASMSGALPMRTALKELRKMLSQPLPPVGKVTSGGRLEKF